MSKAAGRVANIVDQSMAGAARDFARNVTECAPFREYESASSAFRADAEAQKLFHAYQETRRELQAADSWGGATEELRDRFRLREEKLFANAAAERHFAAQENLLVCLRELNEYLAGKLGFDFAVMAKPAGGCC